MKIAPSGPEPRNSDKHSTRWTLFRMFRNSGRPNFFTFLHRVFPDLDQIELETTAAERSAEYLHAYTHARTHTNPYAKKYAHRRTFTGGHPTSDHALCLQVYLLKTPEKPSPLRRHSEKKSVQRTRTHARTHTARVCLLRPFRNLLRPNSAGLATARAEAAAFVVPHFPDCHTKLNAAAVL